MALPKAGVTPDGKLKFAIKYDRDWQEWQVRAYKRSKTGAWKFAEGPTCYANDKEDALQTFHHLVGYAPGYERANPVVVKAQGYDAGPRIATRAEAIKTVRTLVKGDVCDCRRKFGTAIVEVWKNTVWEVKPLRGSQGPLWSRYSIHEV